MFFNVREKNCEVLELEVDDASELTIGHTATPIGNFIVVFGGILSDGTNDMGDPTSTTYSRTRVYDLVQDEWRNFRFENEDKIEYRYFHSCVARGEILYIFGGKSQRFYHNDILTLDMRKSVFKSIMEPKGERPSPRYGHTSVGNSDFMFVFGGYCRNGFTHNDLYSFEFETNTWKKYKTEVVPKRYFHSSVLFKNEIYIINGKTREGKPLDDTHKIDLTNMNKSMKLDIKPSKSTWGQSTFIYNKKIYSFGGIGLKGKWGKRGEKTLREFDPERKKWIKIPFPGTSNVGCAFGSITIWRNHKLVFFGGICENQGTKKRLTRFQKLLLDLPDEMIKHILLFCDHVVLSRLHSSSKTDNRFSIFSCMDVFWEKRVKYIETYGIRYLNIHGGVLSGRFLPRNYKDQIIRMFRQHSEFCKYHYLMNYKKDIQKRDYFQMIQTSHKYIRVVILGDDGSGKTALITRMCRSDFYDGYVPTGGIGDSNRVYIPILEEKKKKKKKKKRKKAPMVITSRGMVGGEHSKVVELELFDTQGQEDYSRFRAFSYFELKNTVTVAFVCFSMVNRVSFENVKKYVSEIQFFMPFTPMILMGLKSDLMGSSNAGKRKIYGDDDEEEEEYDETPVTEKEIVEMAKKYGFLFWNICSAKTSDGCHRNFLESVIICERLRRDEEFMNNYEKKFGKLLLNVVSKENSFARGEVEGYDLTCQSQYSFKLIERSIVTLKKK